MRYIVLVVACVAPSLSVLARQKRSAEDVQEPVSKITESRTGNFDQKLVIDHRKYGNSGEQSSAQERSDEDINFTYPENVQLVPQVPVDPNSPKYTLVPVKTLNTQTSNNHRDVDYNFSSTLPSDFEQEIAKIRIPHIGLPGFITDPPPTNNDGEEDDDEMEDEDGTDEPNLDHLFRDDILEPPEFKNSIKTTRTPPANRLKKDHHSRDIKLIIRNRPDPKKPLIISTSFPLFATNEKFEFGDQNNQAAEELHQIRTNIKDDHDISQDHTPMCLNQKIHTPLMHYGPPQPVPLHSSYPFYHRPSMRNRPRVYVRYPRHYRSFYQVPSMPHYNRVKVMTQNFIQHPRNYYRSRTPIMMPMGEFRASKSPKKKKKKKKAKGECKPKKIIKEIHFHHYDPQLSAQLAPLEGINFKEGEDYEHDIKVITKETEIEDDVKKGHEDYTGHNSNLEKEIDDHKKETEHRLSHPEHYGDSYNPHYPENGSGSTEYIDYNIQTDSQSSIHEPHPAHEYPEERAYKIKADSNTTMPYVSVLPMEGGRYVKHKIIKYYYKTPTNKQK